MAIEMDFFKLDFRACSAFDFIAFWSRCYDQGAYSDDDYDRNLNRQGLLTSRNVQFLLEWKNAKRLSKRKQAIADRTKSKVTKLNEFRRLSKVTEQEFKKFWSLVSTIIGYGIVWKVFLLHISRPNDYPIVDQHVLRAWNYMTKNRVEEPEQTLENYKEYRAFFLELAQRSGEDLRSIDRALMAFGQFLESQFFSSDQN